MAGREQRPDTYLSTDPSSSADSGGDIPQQVVININPTDSNDKSTTATDSPTSCAGVHTPSEVPPGLTNNKSQVQEAVTIETLSGGIAGPVLMTSEEAAEEQQDPRVEKDKLQLEVDNTHLEESVSPGDSDKSKSIEEGKKSQTREEGDNSQLTREDDTKGEEIELVDIDDGDEQTLNAEIPTDLEQLYQIEERRYTPIPITTEETQAEIQLQPVSVQRPASQRTNTSPTEATRPTTASLVNSKSRVNNSTNNLQKSTAALQKSPNNFEKSVANLQNSKTNKSVTDLHPSTSESRPNSKIDKNYQTVLYQFYNSPDRERTNTTSSQLRNRGGKSHTSFGGSSLRSDNSRGSKATSSRSNKTQSLGGRFKKFVTGLVNSKMATSRGESKTSLGNEHTKSALTNLFDDDASRNKLERALQCNPKAVVGRLK